MDDEVFKKLRHKQAKLQKTSLKSISFSRVLNDTIQGCLKLK